MVAYLDAVLNVLECHYPTAHLLIARGGFSGREYMLEDLDDTLPERSREILEDEMGIGFRDCTAGWRR